VGNDRDVGAGLELRVLGAVSVHRGGEAVTISGAKRNQALAVLAAAGGAAVPEHRLVEAMWGSDPPETAAATLQSHISRLRTAVDPLRITKVEGSYALELDGVDVDARRFEDLAAHARATSGLHALAAAAEALDLWRGPAFGDLAELPGVRGEALRLEELRLVITEVWIDARLEQDDAPAVVGDLEALVDAHPLRERFRAQLMLALHRTGRQGDALREAARFRQLLNEELGLDPSSDLRQLESQILGDDPSLARPAPPAAGRRGRGAPEVLRDPTSLIGRETEIDRLLGALGPRHVVTLTGPGGVGKTRVARRVAEVADPGQASGVVLVELAPGRGAGAVVDLVARALDLQQGPAGTLEDAVVDHLSRLEVLLVLDNCEHLLGAAAALVDRLRRSCDRVSILATSRASLGLPGEQIVVLAPLDPPEETPRVTAAALASSPAVQLFVERAKAARPGFQVDEANAAAVGEICRRLDGLPLALELAAARIRALSPAALAARLDERLELLRAERAGGDERHHTLRRVVEWSHALLDPVQQDVFAQLSVFAGSFSLEAAEAVCHPEGGGATGGAAPTKPRSTSVAGAVADLVDHSMLQVSDPSEPRYLVLETLRELGQERLDASGATAAVEARHRALYLELARQAAVGIDSADERTWIERVDRELDNLRAAHHSAVRAGDVHVAASLVASLREHGFRRIRYEITALAEATMAMAGFDEHADAPLVAAVAAYGHWVRGDLDTAIEAAHSSLELQAARQLPPSGLPERILGNALYFKGHTQDASVWIERMVEVARERGAPAGLAHALYMSSVASTSIEDVEAGQAQAAEALIWAERAGSPTAAAQAAYAHGLALRATSPDAAETSLRRSADLGGEAGDRWIRAFALTEVYSLCGRRGEHLSALEGFAEVIDTWLRGGDWANLWLSLRAVFALLVELGAADDAAVLLGKLLASGASVALPAAPELVARQAEETERLAARLGSRSFERAVEVGGSLSDGGAVAHTKAAIERLRSR
jgi:predicted ATPase/DNA-binding SARP family transcriptional activator